MAVKYTYTKSGGHEYSYCDITAVYETAGLSADDVGEIRERAQLLFGQTQIEEDVDRHVELFAKNDRTVVIIHYVSTGGVHELIMGNQVDQDFPKVLEQIDSILDVYIRVPD